MICIKAARGDIASASNKDFIRSTSMMDVVVLAIGLVIFALSIGYVYACDRL
ncbi:MAG: hypothetical protein WBF03_03865 [Xanthobacteraceae bacterium]